ncbi:MAG: shikimate dehydrogenase [Halanaerobiales bacterium]
MDRFAFIIHPLEKEDLYRKFSWAEKVPETVVDNFVRFIPPVKASHITGIKSKTGKEIEGFFIGVPLTSRQILTLPVNKVLKKIIKACKLAEELGAKIVGLGAFTSVVADKGISIAREVDIPVTTGNSYTVATAIEGTKVAAEKMGHKLDSSTLAVVGATGSIGRTVSLMLSKEIKAIILVARNIDRLKLLKEEIQGQNPEVEVSYTTDVNRAVKEAQIVVSASGAVEALIDPYSLQPGAVVCDVARPRDVAASVSRERDDVLVIEGGIVEVPGEVEFNLNFGYPPGTAYACMAETMLLTLEERFSEDYSLGPIIEIEKVKETLEMAAKHGFRLAGLRNSETPLSEEEISAIRERARAGSLVCF